MLRKTINSSSIERGFGCGCGGFDIEEWLLPILIIFLLFSAGGNIFEFLFCEENAIIWIILLVILLGFID